MLDKRDTSFVDKLWELSQACFHTSSWSKYSFEEEFGHKDSVIFGLKVQDKLVAACLIRQYLDEYHVMQIMTHPDYQRKGFAKQILLEAILYAKMHSGTRVLLEVRWSAQAACALYESCGFTFLSKRPHYYHDGEDAKIYVLNIY